jgi:hypothetical protein
MSREVKSLDKFLRIVGFSLYLSFIIFFFFLFFKGLKFSATTFIFSTIYFILIFIALAISKNLHFNVLLSRKQLKHTLFNSYYPLSRFKSFSIVSWLSIAFLLIMAIIYLYFNMPLHAIILMIIAGFTFIYVHKHNIVLHVLNQGIAFDYGEIIALLRWDEIKKISIQGNHVTVELKEKKIKRKSYVEHVDEFRKVVRKFGF